MAKEVKQSGVSESKKSESDINVTEAKEGRRSLASLGDIEREVDRAFDRFFRGGWRWPSISEFPSLPTLKEAFEGKLPKINLIDRDKELVVEAELPGMKKSDIDVTVAENSITIKASRREEEKKEDGEYHRHEISREYTARTVGLPSAVDAAAAKATFEDGVLRVTLPKKESAERHSVSID